jgi:hypothetical protein
MDHQIGLTICKYDWSSILLREPFEFVVEIFHELLLAFHFDELVHTWLLLVEHDHHISMLIGIHTVVNFQPPLAEVGVKLPIERGVGVEDELNV